MKASTSPRPHTPAHKDSQPSFARQSWIDASCFAEHTDREVLDEVVRRVSATPNAVVLMDLDSTLYEVQPRTLAILKEFAESPFGAQHPELRTALERIERSHVGYSLRDTFVALGLSLDVHEIKSAWEAAKRYWGQRFFSNPYLSYDRPYPGSVEFANALYRAGAEIIYLTGRHESGMGPGTRDRLGQDGFPWAVAKTHLLMKGSAELDDLEHKIGAAEFVRSRGHLVASFENEPKNLAALHAIFPDAMHVFVDTVYSDHPAPSREGLYKISGFESFLL